MSDRTTPPTEQNLAAMVLTVTAVTLAFLSVFVLTLDGVVLEILVGAVLSIGAITFVVIVVLDSGVIHNYRWGVGRKRALLAMATPARLNTDGSPKQLNAALAVGVWVQVQVGLKPVTRMRSAPSPSGVSSAPTWASTARRVVCRTCTSSTSRSKWRSS